MKIIELYETISGNKIIGYHRTKKVASIKNMAYSYFEPGAGQMYGPGFYATRDLESQSTPYMKRYGEYIVRVEFEISNYLDMEGDWKKQLEDNKLLDLEMPLKSKMYKNLRDLLNPIDKSFDDPQLQKKYENNRHAIESGYTSVIAQYVLKGIGFDTLSKYFKGIMYTGRADGKCVVAWDINTCTILDYADNDHWIHFPDKMIWKSVKQGSDFLSMFKENPKTIFKLTGLQSFNLIKIILQDVDLSNQLLQVLSNTTQKQQEKLLGLTKNSLVIFNRPIELQIVSKNYSKILNNSPVAQKILDIIYSTFAENLRDFLEKEKGFSNQWHWDFRYTGIETHV